MDRDPRNPDPRFMVRVSSCQHEMRKTLALLTVAKSDPPIYLVVEGMGTWPETLEEMQGHAQYFYEEHTCPTNWLRIPMISVGGNHDPHGLFEFVDAVWMMDEYEALGESHDPGEQDEYLLEVFPQLAGGPTIDLRAESARRLTPPSPAAASPYPAPVDPPK